MGSPSLKFRIQARINPILVLSNRNLAVIRRNSLCDATEILQGIVVHADPVADIAAGHALNVEQIAERQGCNKDRDLGQCFQITDVTKPEVFPSKIQFRINAGIALNIEGYVFVAQPVGVPPAKLPVTQRPLSVNFALGVVQLPEMKQRLALLGQLPVNFLLILIVKAIP